ncbi:MAG: exodeoxyribonuclease VII small subunit [Agathobacter sp.]|nr:exodeoxyribonuclease VII small subunit [Agathobacter sp.]
MSNEAMKSDEISLEERFEHIEEIIDKMETGDVSLDMSFELYKNGLEEIKAANAMLDDMEKAMLILNEDGTLEEF